VKSFFLFLFVLLTLLSITANAEKKVRYLKPGEILITEEQVLQGLSGTDWQKKLDFLEQWGSAIQHEKYFSNSTVKARMIQILKEVFQFYDDKINEYIKAGATPDDAKHKIYKEHPEVQSSIIYLTGVIWEYNDPETIPLIIRTSTLYGSDEFSLENFLRHFGKNTFSQFKKIANEGKDFEKSAVLSRLGGWANWTLNKDIIAKYKITMRASDDLNKQEIQEAKKILINNLNSGNSTRTSYVIFGLKSMARGTQDSKEKKELKDVIKSQMVHKDVYVKQDVAKALGEIGDETDIPDLEKMLTDPGLDPSNEFFREKQIRAAGKSDLPKVYLVREAARKAIEKIKTRAGQP
jgi:hypothetical protein